MGQVFRAYDDSLDREVAIKLVHPLRVSSPESLLRMRREAQAMARMSDTNVVQVYDAGEIDGQVYVAMELVAGATLRGWLKQPRTVSETLALFAAVGDGLTAAHDAGVVHRDLKPDNILVTAHGVPKIADFGLSALQEHPREHALPAVGEGTAVTVTGAVLGTPAYMAPEQLEGLPATRASDQFALCICLWEALYGARPFGGETLAELTVAVVHGALRLPARRRGVPRHVAAALRRGLSKDPRQRWPSIGALVRELRRPAPRRVRRWTKIVLVTGVATFGTLFTVGSMVAADAMQQLATTAAQAQQRECQRNDDVLEGTWDAGARGRVQARFADVVPALDRWAETWIDAQTTGCTDFAQRSVPRAVSAARVRCLQSGRAALTSVLARLEQPGVDVGQARRLVAELPSGSECAGGAALTERYPIPAGT